MIQVVARETCNPSLMSHPMRVAKEAERDFQELPAQQSRVVLAYFRRPALPRNVLMLKKGRHRKLGRGRIGALRYLFCVEEDATYILRIMDKKDFYRVADHFDSRAKPTGIPLAEFITKHDRSHKDPSPVATSYSAVPPGCGPPAVNEYAPLPPTRRGMIDTFVNVVREIVCEEMETARALLRDEVVQFSAAVDDRTQRFDAIDTKHEGIAEELDRLETDQVEMLVGQQALSKTVEAVSDRCVALADLYQRELAGLTSRMDGIGTRLEETPARLAGIDQGLRAGLADLGREMRAELRSIEAHRVRTEARCKYFSHSLRGEFNERIDVLVSGIAHDLTRWFTMVEEYGESQNAIARRLDDAIAQMGRLEGLAEAHVAALRAVECHVDGLRRQIDSCHWTSRWTRVVAWLRSIGSRIR